MSARIVSVFGATGQQGSAVVKALLKDGTFSPRAIARNPNSEAAKALTSQGVEVVQGDAQDKASLVQALKGSEAVFAMTAPIIPPGPTTHPPNEWSAGKNIVDAAQEVGVKFLIWTGMPSIARISDGKYTQCLHYDQKEQVEKYLQASNIPNVSLHLGGFLENLWKFGNLRKTETGFDLTIPVFKPGERQAFTWVDRDVPQSVLAVLKSYTDPAKLAKINGGVFPIVNACIPYSELAERIGKTLGVPVTYTTIPATGHPFMDEMFSAHVEYSGLFTSTPVPNPGLAELGVKLGTIDEFLEQEVKQRFSA
ncbi:NmrA domain-containing protein [Mycena indigotica]|uniref:NmrA domain-containing protein n=1 Tax=Mycena indigotica TaxID=2126181 RepID=A0A8H6WEK1_9AGAR|nr:NmrA domain-containing protein [Mycena indigotica]KAF7314897.1 NmrA domain-containing protein [Mycena indigotica]